MLAEASFRRRSLAVDARIQAAEPADLERINAVVVSAVYSWPVPDRLKKLSLPPLRYTPLDFDDYRFLVASEGGLAVGVAAWTSEHPEVGPSGERAALLHGLYVRGEAQGGGLGRRLLAEARLRAARAGCAGLYVKAQRVATSYFEQLGLQRLTEGAADYPYLFWCPADLTGTP